MSWPVNSRGAGFVLGSVGTSPAIVPPSRKSPPGSLAGRTNGAKIGRNCLVGAGALVTEGKEFPDGSLIVGAPARVIRALDEKALAGLARPAGNYVLRWKRYAAGLEKIAD